MSIEEIRLLEREMAPPFPDSPLDCFGWAPYDLDVFDRLLSAAIGAARGSAFLDAGCGLGTKCLRAAERGLTAYGIDRVPAYVKRAAQLGVSCEVADVREWKRYGEFSIVYVSHPLRPGAEESFETWLHGQMAPGSVLMTPRIGSVPGDWKVVLEEEYQRPYSEAPRRRGVYVKPPERKSHAGQAAP
jgi:trans-aconitate methyltransferase